MSALRDAFNEEQIALILEALDEKAKRHKGWSAMTINSGYGKGTTLDKANKHKEIAEAINELESYISTESN